MSRTIAIGDIHGGLKGLEQVLERAEITTEDTLIFLGDYVDGWSESAQLIERLMEIEKTHNCIFILGNHDAWCREWLRFGTANPIWLKHGGKPTMASYARLSPNLDEHLEFFSRMENYVIDDKNRLFVHAGFTSMHGPKQEHYSSNYGWDRTLWETAMAAHGNLKPKAEYYPDRLTLFTEIYIGHTPVTRWGIHTPWQRCNVWNVDTGAAFKGSLSVIDIDSKEIWQSDPLFELYPKEKGRN